jgi:hypothetical protein
MLTAAPNVFAVVGPTPGDILQRYAPGIVRKDAGFWQ